MSVKHLSKRQIQERKIFQTFQNLNRCRKKKLCTKSHKLNRQSKRIGTKNINSKYIEEKLNNYENSLISKLRHLESKLHFEKSEKNRFSFLCMSSLCQKYVKIFSGRENKHKQKNKHKVK